MAKLKNDRFIGKKTAPINILVQPEVKANLIKKAKSHNLNLTQYFEKIASEPVVFLDETILRAISLLQPKNL